MLDVETRKQLIDEDEADELEIAELDREVGPEHRKVWDLDEIKRSHAELRAGHFFTDEQVRGVKAHV